MVAVLEGPVTAQATVDAFKVDYNAFKALSGHGNKTRIMAVMEGRAVFKHTSVLQYVEAELFHEPMP